MELGVQAVSAMQRWLQYSTGSAMPARRPSRCTPLAQDKRFDDPLWHAWPWNQLSQGFLLHPAMVAPRHARACAACRAPCRRRHLRRAPAARRLRPSNFIATNPVAQQVTLPARRQNLVHGMRARRRRRAGALAAAAPVRLRPGRDVAVTPGKVVLRNHLVELLRYDPVTPQVHAVPLLIVPAWIMKYYILDLSPAQLAGALPGRQGHTVYMISWKNPGPTTATWALDDYRRLGVMAALDAINARDRRAEGQRLRLLPGRHPAGDRGGGDGARRRRRAWPA
jgi:polyhydroxyalkanoate synthase